MNNSFTKEEWEFLTMASPMRLKPIIQEKIDLKLSLVKQELGSVSEKYRSYFIAWKVDSSMTAKIYKGEHYLGMPWMALDFPKNYVKNYSLAFRVLVLWGDAIYTSMLAEGGVEIEDIELSTVNDYPTSVYYVNNANQWIQAIEGDSCKLITDLSAVLDHRKTYGFTRLFQRIEFTEWDNLEETCVKSFENQCALLLELMKLHRGD